MRKKVREYGLAARATHPDPWETMPELDPIGSVLVATDLESTSREVVNTAAAIARSADATLHLLHVLDTGSLRHVSRNVRDNLIREQAAEAGRALELQKKTLEDAGTRVASAECAKGGPAHRLIVERVRETGADLLVVGSHARAGHGHRLGSTADRLLRTSPVPCLVVRGEGRLPARRVAALTDVSELGRRAARLAGEWLPVLGEPAATLDVVHVGDRSLHTLDPSLEEVLRGKLDEEVAELRARSPDAAAVIGADLRWAYHPVEGAVETAVREGHDLLVVATHGHGPLRRFLIGSVAMGLAQCAPCPILVVPPGAGPAEPDAP